MLADGKTEDVGGSRELEAVAAASGQLVERCFCVGDAHMAVLWERIVFSLSSKFWNSFGLRTLRGTVECQSGGFLNLEIFGDFTVVVDLPAS